jgi:hypothetical protein
MEPKYITFEQAKWLKEKGYEIDTDEVLFFRDEINNIEEHQIKNRDVIYNAGINYIVDEDEYRVYEQHQVVDWLLEEHGIWVHSAPENNEEDIVKWYYTIQRIDTEVRFIRRFGEFNTPQEVYSAAFDYLISQNII